MKHEAIISIQDGNIVDSQGKKRIFQGATVSPYSRDFPIPSISQADTFFAALQKHNITLLRWQILWEDVEGEAPDQYNEAYLADLRTLLKKAEEAGILVFLEPVMKDWGSSLGGHGAPAWTVQLADLEESLDNGQKQQAMFTLFWAGKKMAPDTLVEGDNIQDYLQEHYIAAMKHTARRVKDCKTVVGFGIMAKGTPGDLKALEMFPLNFENDCLKPFQKKFIAAFQKKHSHYLFLAEAMGTGEYSTWKFSPHYNKHEAHALQKEGGVIPDVDLEASKVITLLSLEPPQKLLSIFISKDKVKKQVKEKIKKTLGGGNSVMIEFPTSQGIECVQEVVQEEGLSYFVNIAMAESPMWVYTAITSDSNKSSKPWR